MPSDDIYRHLFGGRVPSLFSVPDKKEKRMEIVTIERRHSWKDRALEALAKKVREICRGKFPEYG